MADLLRAFVIGTSLPATIYTLGFVGLARRHRPVASFDYTTFAVAMPVLFGCANVLASVLIRYQNTRLKFAMFGAVFGLLIGLLALYMDISVGLEGSYKYFLLVTCPVIYAAIWGLPIHALNDLMFT